MANLDSLEKEFYEFGTTLYLTGATEEQAYYELDNRDGVTDDLAAAFWAGWRRGEDLMDDWSYKQGEDRADG